MIILYVLLVAYILAVNFYAFLLVKSLRDKERQEEVQRQAEPLSIPAQTSPTANQNERFFDRPLTKMFTTGILGGAITLYACMFIFKYKRSDLLLMIALPLLGVLNIYIFVLLFRSGFSFLVIR